MPEHCKQDAFTSFFLKGGAENCMTFSQPCCAIPEPANRPFLRSLGTGHRGAHCTEGGSRGQVSSDPSPDPQKQNRIRKTTALPLQKLGQMSSPVCRLTWMTDTATRPPWGRGQEAQRQPQGAEPARGLGGASLPFAIKKCQKAYHFMISPLGLTSGAFLPIYEFALPCQKTMQLWKVLTVVPQLFRNVDHV